MILSKIKTLFNNFNSRCYFAVITVPAYFNDSQRQATKDMELFIKCIENN